MTTDAHCDICQLAEICEALRIETDQARARLHELVFSSDYERPALIARLRSEMAVWGT